MTFEELIANALDTNERGESLIAVARDAHNAELALLKIAQNQEKRINEGLIDESKVIKYYRDSKYGNEFNYIVDPEIARNITILTRQKTISSDHMSALINLGFTFKEVLKPR